MVGYVNIMDFPRKESDRMPSLIDCQQDQYNSAFTEIPFFNRTRGEKSQTTRKGGGGKGLPTLPILNLAI